jgi:hypothetical protein
MKILSNPHPRSNKLKVRTEDKDCNDSSMIAMEIEINKPTGTVRNLFEKTLMNKNPHIPYKTKCPMES